MGRILWNMDPRVHIQWGSIFNLTPAPALYTSVSDRGRVTQAQLSMFYTPKRGGSRILEKGEEVDRVAVARGRSPSPARGSGGHRPLKHFERIECLKWHFLHSEKAKCLILQFANIKILPFSE